VKNKGKSTGKKKREVYGTIPLFPGGGERIGRIDEKDRGEAFKTGHGKERGES